MSFICLYLYFHSFRLFFYRFSSLYCDIFSSPTFSIRILTPAFLLFNLSGAFSAPHLVHFRPPLKSLIKISCCCRFPGLPIWEPVWTLPRPLTWPHLLVSQPADLLSMLSQSSYDSIVEKWLLKGKKTVVFFKIWTFCWHFFNSRHCTCAYIGWFKEEEGWKYFCIDLSLFVLLHNPNFINKVKFKQMHWLNKFSIIY